MLDSSNTSHADSVFRISDSPENLMASNDENEYDGVEPPKLPRTISQSMMDSLQWAFSKESSILTSGGFSSENSSCDAPSPNLFPGSDLTSALPRNTSFLSFLNLEDDSDTDGIESSVLRTTFRAASWSNKNRQDSIRPRSIQRIGSQSRLNRLFYHKLFNARKTKL
ncbi:hypothetical protein HK096_001800 [Nowakowskiella sp. JEL0078]|nr:hypothetical protein HK096_001800 [Nowakowskiella sp. JEL0078]